MVEVDVDRTSYRHRYSPRALVACLIVVVGLASFVAWRSLGRVALSPGVLYAVPGATVEGTGLTLTARPNEPEHIVFSFTASDDARITSVALAAPVAGEVQIRSLQYAALPDGSAVPTDSGNGLPSLELQNAARGFRVLPRMTYFIQIELALADTFPSSGATVSGFSTTAIKLGITSTQTVLFPLPLRLLSAR